MTFFGFRFCFSTSGPGLWRLLYLMDIFFNRISFHWNCHRHLTVLTVSNVRSQCIWYHVKFRKIKLWNYQSFSYIFQTDSQLPDQCFDSSLLSLPFPFIIYLLDFLPTKAPNLLFQIDGRRNNNNNSTKCNNSKWFSFFLSQHIYFGRKNRDWNDERIIISVAISIK